MAIAIRLEAIAIRLEGMWPSLLGWRPSLLGWRAERPKKQKKQKIYISSGCQEV